MNLLSLVDTAVKTHTRLTKYYEGIKTLRTLHERHLSLVFEAQDRQTSEDVVIKVLNPALDSNYVHKAFLREGKLLEHLRGLDCVIPLISPPQKLDVYVGLNGRRQVLSLTYLVTRKADMTLDELIQKGLSVPTILEIFSSAVRALKLLRKHGVYHRDLTPYNCMVFQDAPTEIVLIDFMYSCAAGQYRLSAGTEFDQQYARPITNRDYAALELFCGFGRDPRYAFGADCFSLGLLLFEMVTRKKWSSLIYNQEALSDLTQLFYTYVNDARREEAYRAVIEKVRATWRLPSLIEHACCEADDRLLPLEKIYLRLSDLDFLRRETDLEYLLRVLEELKSSGGNASKINPAGEFQKGHLEVNLTRS